MSGCPHTNERWGEPCSNRFPRMPSPEVTQVFCLKTRKTVVPEGCKTCFTTKPGRQSDLVQDFGFPNVPKQLKLGEKKK